MLLNDSRAPTLALLFYTCARSLEARERPQNEKLAVRSCTERFSLGDAYGIHGFLVRLCFNIPSTENTVSFVYDERAVCLRL